MGTSSSAYLFRGYERHLSCINSAPAIFQLACKGHGRLSFNSFTVKLCSLTDHMYFLSLAFSDYSIATRNLEVDNDVLIAGISYLQNLFDDIEGICTLSATNFNFFKQSINENTILYFFPSKDFLYYFFTSYSLYPETNLGHTYSLSNKG